MEDLRKKAKEFRNNKKYDLSIDLYQQIFKPNSDKWIAWEYADSLKRTLQIDEAIIISKNTYLNDPNFKFNNDLLAWLLFEKYFKNIKEKYTLYETQHLYEICQFIIKIVPQTDTSPLTKTIIKTSKILIRQRLYEQVISIIDFIDLDLLSDEPKIYEDSNKKQKQYQSEKEAIYIYKSKALLRLNKLEECISCCNDALNFVNTFHHDNDIWLQVRIAKCFSKLGNIDDSFSRLHELSIKHNHWYIYYEIAKIYLLKEDFTTALHYMYRAAVSLDPPKVKVTLYFDIANILEKIGDTYNSNLHAQFVVNTRLEEDWNIPDKLRKLVNKIDGPEINGPIKLHYLNNFWISKIHEFTGTHNGVVSKIHPNGKFGFVQSDKGSYFFKTSSFFEKRKVSTGDRIRFCIIDSYDRAKDRFTKEAAYITIDT